MRDEGSKSWTRIRLCHCLQDIQKTRDFNHHPVPPKQMYSTLIEI